MPVRPSELSAAAPWIGKVVSMRLVRETEAELVHHLGSDGVVVGNDKTAIVLHIHVVRQERIRECPVSRVLPTEAGIDLLIGSDVVIQPDVQAVGIRRRGLQRFIVEAAPRGIDIRQRVIFVQQVLGIPDSASMSGMVLLGKGWPLKGLVRTLVGFPVVGSMMGSPFKLPFRSASSRHQILLRG